MGSNADVLPLATARTRKIDLALKSVLPGFNDAHTHPVESGVDHLHKVACDKESIENIQAALHERALQIPPGQWVLGFLYDDGKTPRPINRHDLDAAVPDHPVLVEHRGGHTAFVNSMALKLAQVNDQTPILPVAASSTMPRVISRVLWATPGSKSFLNSFRIKMRARTIARAQH